MKLNRNALSAIKLFQLFGGFIENPTRLGVSLTTLKALCDLEWIEPCGKESYRLTPLPLPLRSAPYNTIDPLLSYDPTSYFNRDSMIGLGNLLRMRPIKTVVELGSWTGISTIFMALFMHPQGKVYAVDHWKGSKEHTQDCSHLYSQFLSNIIHTRLTDTIIPLRMTTLEAARLSLPPIDLIYVDASHDAESVYQDLVAWEPHIRLSGGVLCGDDYLWGAEEGYPVQQGLRRFIDSHPYSIKAEGTFWQLI